MTAKFTKTLTVGLLAVTALTGSAWAQSVTLTYLTTNQPDNVAAAEAAIAAYQKMNPDVRIDLETRPGGSEGDNIVKTRLATGQMTDVFTHNSGSLFQAINPVQNLVPLTDEAWQANVQDSFKSVVTAGGDVYGAPQSTAMGGGILYNIPIYEELGLEIPKTWADFMANNAAIKAAGKVAVIQTYKDTWTSQLFVLADYYNVIAEDPTFAEEYTAGTAKYADRPAALRGFAKHQEVAEGDFFNADFGAATFTDGVRMVATGEGAHYPMLTFAAGTIATDYPENLKDVGFFAQPGESADSNGLTIWMPGGVYIPKTANVEEAKKFVAYLASVEGCNTRTATIGATGPYMVSGCDLPDDVATIVSDMLPYFADGGHNGPALEFLSPVKGPSLEQITVEVGSGIRDAASAAALYDEDVRKQALQLGLPGWE